jgi:hypothetical protein
MKMIVVCVLAMVLLGCEKENVAVIDGKDGAVTNATKATVASVKKGLDEIIEIYESEYDRRSRPNMDCVGLIRSLEKVTDQVTCYRYFMDRVFALKLDGLSYRQQSWVISLLEHTLDDVASIAADTDESWVSYYDVVIKRYVWWKAQILRVRPRHRREKNEPRTFDIERDREFYAWQSIYYGGIKDFENTISCMEFRLERTRQLMNEGEWTCITNLFEKSLGRPVRDGKRALSDYTARIWVDFPDVKFDKDALP